MITTFDHVIAIADDIRACEASYEAAGFSVTHREDEGEKSNDHLLICFEDGSYVELFAFHPNNEEAKKHRWYRYSEVGEGYCDYSVVTENLKEILSEAEQKGVDHTPFAEGGKTRIDGEPWVLRLSMFGMGVTSPELPFVLEDVTPRAVRVNGSSPHPNGATGIRAVTIVTDNAARAHAGLVLLTGDNQPETLEAPEGRTVRYSFGDREIRLLEPVADTEAHARLDEVGPVVWEMEIATHGEKKTLDPAKLHGARITLV